MITIKLPIINKKEVQDSIQTEIIQFNSILKYSYNRFVENKSLKDIKLLVKNLRSKKYDR